MCYCILYTVLINWWTGVISNTDISKQGHSLTEKELPQEQPWSAWGFLSTRKVARISSWLKSTVAPFTNSRLSWSTIMPTPPCSNTLDADGNRVDWINKQSGNDECETIASKWPFTCHLHSCYYQQKTCTETRSSLPPLHGFSETHPCPWFPLVSGLKEGHEHG